MVKAYEAYKASVNPEKKEKTGSSPTMTQIVLKAADAAGKRIETLDMGELYREEKEELAGALMALKVKIEAALAVLAETVTEEIPGE